MDNRMTPEDEVAQWMTGVENFDAELPQDFQLDEATQVFLMDWVAIEISPERRADLYATYGQLLLQGGPEAINDAELFLLAFAPFDTKASVIRSIIASRALRASFLVKPVFVASLSTNSPLFTLSPPLF